MFKVLGCNDEVTTCECCGRTNLKKTVALESATIGIVRYGVDCAAAAVYGAKSCKNRESMNRVASAVSYARKWIGVYGNAPEVLEKIASGIRTHFCSATVVRGMLSIDGQLL